MDFSPIFTAIEAVCHASIIRNFSSTGRFGGETFGGGDTKWKKSRRKGQTLSDTSKLKQSVDVEVVQDSDGLKIVLGSNLDYAAIHHFGFKGRQDYTRKRKTKDGGYEINQYTRNMNIEERPIFVLQEEDLEAIALEIMDFVMEEMGAG